MASSEIMELFRAAIHDDWETVDRAAERLDASGWPGGVTGITAVFGLAVQRKFQAEYEVRDVVRFVAEARAEIADPSDIPPNEAEALVLAALGDTARAEDVPTDVAIPTQVALALKIISDEKLADPELERFLNEAEALAARWTQAGTS